MPVPTPFHERTAAGCTSFAWKDWAGCYAVRRYDTCHELEYYALRHSAGLIDVSPLFKYEVTGPDAAEFLAWMTVKDVRRMRVGRVSYLCWCDDAGKVLDDGTVARLRDDLFRVTAAEPALDWLVRRGQGFDLRIEDVTRRTAALALQGPLARDTLARATDAVSSLRFFRIVGTEIGGVPVEISRTGYTGDLGYELWVDASRATEVWDAIVDAGRPLGIRPAGLDALDMTRIEAGFVMNGVDYHSAHHCPIESRKSTPFELGLGWTVQLDRDPFVGQAALSAERARGPEWGFVGLELDWVELERLYAGVGLPPAVPAEAWRTPVPVFDRRRKQVGYATSGTWSPLLKRNLALAHVGAEHADPDTQLRMEVTVEFQRRTVGARVVSTPFFDPPRKRA